MNILYDAKNNTEYIITKTPENTLLTTLGVFVESKIKKLVTYKFGGPVLILVDAREVAIGKDIAKLIEVEEQGEDK